MRTKAKDRERFERYVDRSGGPNACHPWTGAKVEKGYGRFWFGSRLQRAHRVAWVLAGNEITPEKPHVLHNCPGGDNPACCNPRHLWTGTNADNLCDMALKGRGFRSNKGLPFGAMERRNGRFQASVWIDNKTVHLGTYDTAEEASAAALKRKRGRRAPHRTQQPHPPAPAPGNQESNEP